MSKSWEEELIEVGHGEGDGMHSQEWEKVKEEVIAVYHNADGSFDWSDVEETFRRWRMFTATVRDGMIVREKWGWEYETRGSSRH